MAGVGVDVHHEIDAAVADVGDVGREAVRQLALERDVPRVQRPLVEPGGITSNVELRSDARRRNDAVGRNVQQHRRREAGRHRAGALEVVRHAALVVLLDREGERVAVVGERNRARAVAGADDRVAR